MTNASSPVRFALVLVAATLLFGVAVPARAAAQAAPTSCADLPGFAELDFWLGEWVVHVSEQEVGRNRIEKVLSGCAIEEHWTGAGGQRGQSLFYFVPALGEWRQVWVTETATATGGVKEKRLVGRVPGGGVRFQGEIPLAGGGSYLDRTTLAPLGDGRVRQHIEISTDGGATWRTIFDAVYARPGSG